MEKNEKKAVTNKSIMMLLVVIIIALLAIGLIAWSRYRTTINGSASATSAQWSFKLEDGNPVTEEIDFSLTRTDENTSVAEGLIAPGTYGKLELGLNATGTQTALTYSIDASINDKPTNLKLYSDEERTMELIITDAALSKVGYMSLDEIGTRTETIYWEWPEETVTKPVITDDKLTDLEINKTEFDALIAAEKFTEANDMLDTAESGKQVSMTVSVTAKQLIGNPTLADLVQVGDYVNYNAANTVDGNVYSYTTNEDITGDPTTTTFTSSDSMQWRVLSVDKETGTVELISAEQTENIVYLSGLTALKNAENFFKEVGAVYGHGKGAVEGRSITIEDIEPYSSYDKSTYNNGIHQYGDTAVFTLKSPDNVNVNLEASEVEKITGSQENPATLVQTAYLYDAKKYFSNNTIYDMIFKKSEGENASYWVASHSINLFSKGADFVIKYIGSSQVKYNAFYYTTGTNKRQYGAVRPIVKLQSNIETTGKVDNVWQLKID